MSYRKRQYQNDLARAQAELDAINIRIETLDTELDSLYDSGKTIPQELDSQFYSLRTERQQIEAEIESIEYRWKLRHIAPSDISELVSMNID